MFDEVHCNHDLFGAHKGSIRQTSDLEGLLQVYEITPKGRLILPGKPKFDVCYHGMLRLAGFGRAVFKRGTIQSFEADDMEYYGSSERSYKRPPEIAMKFRQKALKHTINQSLERTGRISPENEKSLLDEIERRLREVVSIVDPRPLRRYFVLRSANVVSLCTSTATKVSKKLMADLTNGVWPGWDVIVKAVPELDNSQTRFDSSALEWYRSARNALVEREDSRQIALR